MRKSLQKRLDESAARRAAKSARRKSLESSKGTKKQRTQKARAAETRAYNKLAAEKGLPQREWRDGHFKRRGKGLVSVGCEKFRVDDGDITFQKSVSPREIPFDTPLDGSKQLGGYYQACDAANASVWIGFLADSDGSIGTGTKITVELELCRQNLADAIERAFSGEAGGDSDLSMADGIFYSWIVPLRPVSEAERPQQAIGKRQRNSASNRAAQKQRERERFAERKKVDPTIKRNKGDVKAQKQRYKQRQREAKRQK